MDDHPPSWESNGAEYLVPVTSEISDDASRLNLFLPRANDALARIPQPLMLAKGLAANYSLTSLELYRCNLDEPAITALAQALSVNKYLRYLGLGRNRFYTAGGVLIAECLKVNQTLTAIDLSWNELRDEFAVSFAEMLLMNNSLQKVILDKNKISGDGVAALSHALTSNRKIRFFSINQNLLNAVGATFLGKALVANANSSLQTLDVSSNAVSQEGMFSFFSALTTAPRPLTLVTLNLAYNKIGPAVMILGSALQSMPLIRELNLEYTYLELTPQLVEFSKALSSHSSLVTVSFARNPSLGDLGVDCLCEAMAMLSTLKYCDLTDCGMTSASLGDALPKLVRVAKNLTTLHLNDNDFSAEGSGVAVAKLLSLTTSLQFLGMQRCKLGMKGAEGMGSTLQFRAPSITGLSLRGNRLTDAGFAQLLPFFLHHGHFHFLDLAQNDLTQLVFPRVPDLLQANCALPYVVLEDHVVVDRERCKMPWSQLVREGLPDCLWDLDTCSLGPHPLPPLCHAQMELQTSLPPSAGFATYSAANGSTLRRQVESTVNLLHGLLPYAGLPVRHCDVWEGKRIAAVPQLKQGSFQGPTDAVQIAKFESNVGGLLVSDDQMRREFNRLDIRGDGYLRREDFKNVYRSLEHYGVERSEGEIDRALQRYGGKQDIIPYDLFCLIMLKLAQH